MVNATNNDLYHNSLVKDSPNIGNTNGTMELSNNISALIDKIHIKNVMVTDVKDVCSLRDRDILIVKEGKNNYLFNERGEGYSSISISDAKNFDRFDYYLTRWGHISSNIQISIDDTEYRNRTKSLRDGPPRLRRSDLVLFQLYITTDVYEDMKHINHILLKHYFNYCRRPMKLFPIRKSFKLSLRFAKRE